MTPILIQSSDTMDKLVQQLSNEKVIAVDTEFFRETSYYPKLALVQIATDSIVACIDPLAFDARPALKKLLLNENTIKIIHSCSQDLEVLFYYLGQAPRNVYDTQIANALLSKQHQVSYASLVESELNVQIDKSQTRSNWLQRPLTKKQIQYAGDDVYYLYQLHSVLEKKLHNTNRKTWFDEESSLLLNSENNFQVASDKLWRRVKGATALKKSQLVIVQFIALWREQLAQENDKTRRKILSDETVLHLAINPPDSPAILKQHFDRHTHFNDEEIQQLFETIQAAMNCPEQQWPDNRFSALDEKQKIVLKTLQHYVNSQAEKLGVSSAILCSRRELESLIIKQNELPDIKLSILQGWRLQHLGQLLVEIIKTAT